MALENELVGGGDAVARAGVVDAQDQGVVEDARPLEDGPAPGAAAQDGYGELLAAREVHLGRGLIGVAQDDEIFRQGPEAQEFVAAAGLTEVEQHLVAGKVLLGRPQGEVAELHVL